MVEIFDDDNTIIRPKKYKTKNYKITNNVILEYKIIKYNKNNGLKMKIDDNLKKNNLCNIKTNKSLGININYNYRTFNFDYKLIFFFRNNKIQNI